MLSNPTFEKLSYKDKSTLAQKYMYTVCIEIPVGGKKLEIEMLISK